MVYDFLFAFHSPYRALFPR